MATWGVLRLPDGSVSGGLATGDGAMGAAVAAHLDGAVALGYDVPLAVALASLPEHVAIVVELAAAVAARPMADALKRVDGDVVVGGLARDGLLTPCLPHVYRRDTLAAVLAAAAGTLDSDAVALLLAAGHAVRVVPVQGGPVTLRERA
jgi:hypothetical protein